MTFDIEVFNQGNVDAFNVSLSDYIPVGLILSDANWTNAGGLASLVTPIATIPVGGSSTESITFIIDPAFMGTSITNNAEIASADDDTDPTNTPPTDVDSTPGTEDGTTPDPNNDDTADTAGGDDYDPETINIGQVFDLALTKTVSAATPGPYAPGSTITYMVTVVNQGTLDAFNIGLNDYIPAGLLLADATWTDAGGVAMLNAPIATLAAGASTMVPITFTIDPAFMGTSITNNAEIASADDDTDPTNTPPTDVDSTPGTEDGTTPDPNNDDTADTAGGDDYDPETVAIVQDYDLALTKVLAAGQSTVVAPGDQVIFTVTVINQGSLTANSFDVTDFIPNGFTFNPASNPSWTDNLDGTATVTLSSANGGLPAGGLPPSAFTTVDIILDVAANAPQGQDLVNWAEISADDGMDGDSTPDIDQTNDVFGCLLYTSPSPRDATLSRMPSSA